MEIKYPCEILVTDLIWWKSISKHYGVDFFKTKLYCIAKGKDFYMISSDMNSPIADFYLADWQFIFKNN